MPDRLLDNPNPARAQDPLPQQVQKRDLSGAPDSDTELNVAGGPAPVPQVSINRSTVAELERRRILRLQAAALLILAGAAVLSLIYVGKFILVVVLVSILLSFVLAPVVDFLTRFQIPRGLGALIAVVLLVVAIAAGSYVSYSRAMDFMHQLPSTKPKSRR